MPTYTMMGNLTVVPAADIANDTAEINVRGDGRVGSGSGCKHAGMMVLRDNGGADYDLVIATGAGATDKWLLFEAGTAVTPS